MLPSTVNLLTFTTVAETGQFKRAAQTLNLSESAVSHQISRLENQLSATLFERSRSGVKLTAAGHAFHHHIVLGLNEIRSGVEAIALKQDNLVSISAPRTFAAMWLAPRISTFSNEFPDIELQITATDRVCDLKRENIDIAFRVSDIEWPDCQQVLFCRQELTPVANEQLATTVKHLGWKEALEKIPFIINQTHRREWLEWSAQTGIDIQDQSMSKKLQSYDLVQAAAIRGFGIALARSPLSSDAFSEGNLFKLQADKISVEFPYHLVWSKSRRMKKSTRNFIDWVIQTQNCQE